VIAKRCGLGTVAVAILTVGIAIGVASCLTDAPPQQRPLGSIPTDDLVYDDQAAGFTLTFPPSWHDRYDVDARSGPIAAAQWPLTGHAIAFIYKPVEPDQPQVALVTVLVYHHADWDRIAAGQDLPGTVVAEQGDDVYVAAVAQANPFPPGSRDAQNFDAMRLTTAGVKEGLTPR
jgi:hypothetical protein